MADPSIILELIRQAQQERNAPTAFDRGMNSSQQIMQGIQQGFQLYDTIKSMGEKHGTTATVNSPGQPRANVAPVSPGQSLMGATGPGSSIAAATTASPPFGGAPSLPNFPAPSGPVAGAGPQTVNVPGMAQIEQISKAAETSPDFGRYIAGLQGIDIGKTKEELKLDQLNNFVTTDANGVPHIIQMTGKITNGGNPALAQSKIELQKAAIAQKQQELQIEQAKFEQSVKQFGMLFAQKQKSEEDKHTETLVRPFIDGINNPKLKDNKDYYQFANSMMQEIQTTGTIPEYGFQMAKVFGLDLPWRSSPATVKTQGSSVETPKPKVTSSPGKIRVKRKSDGQPGTILESEFDGSKYTRL